MRVQEGTPGSLTVSGTVQPGSVASVNSAAAGTVEPETATVVIAAECTGVAALEAVAGELKSQVQVPRLPEPRLPADPV